MGNCSNIDSGEDCYLPSVLDEVLTIGGLSTVVQWLIECRPAACLVEGGGATAHLRGVTFLSASINAIVVHSVWVIEESNLSWVSLNIPPATALPPAGHQVKLLVHSDLTFHHLVLCLLGSSHSLRVDLGCSGKGL